MVVQSREVDNTASRKKSVVERSDVELGVVLDDVWMQGGHQWERETQERSATNLPRAVQEAQTLASEAGWKRQYPRESLYLWWHLCLREPEKRQTPGCF